MARRYTTFAGLGRCSVILEGRCGEARQRICLVQDLAHHHIFVVQGERTRRHYDDVTRIPTMQLLASLCRHEWWIPLGSVEEESSGDDGQAIGGTLL